MSPGGQFRVSLDMSTDGEALFAGVIARLRGDRGEATSCSALHGSPLSGRLKLSRAMRVTGCLATRNVVRFRLIQQFVVDR